MKKHLLIAAGFLLLLAGVSALFLQLPGETRAAGTSRYASPTGSSTSCTSASPCALQTALNAAVAGDEVIAKDLMLTDFRIFQATRSRSSSWITD